MNNLSQLACEAGIVGAGGAGFPTHVKINAKVDCIILNAAECEPLITVDQMLLLEYTDMLLQQFDELREFVEAEDAYIAIKAKHEKIIEKLEERIVESSYHHIHVYALEDFYPAGDEVVTVFEVTGRIVPQGGIPLEVGVIVLNVETLWNLARASEGYPNTHKWITVAGELRQPGIYRAPIGMKRSEFLEKVGAYPNPNQSVIDGGPMMGNLIENLDEPITKTTKALLILPNDNPIIVNAKSSIDYSLRLARSVCCQCRLCSDLCPRGLLGYDCEPHKSILAASYAGTTESSTYIQAMTCSECGACDQFACPMGLMPRRVNQALKKTLRKAGAKPPKERRLETFNQFREYRKIPVSRLKQRLRIDSYESPVQIIDDSISTSCASLLLSMHIGAPSEVVVQVGDQVEVGQVIAKCSDKTPVSTNLHASIQGIVKEIDDKQIVIEGGHEIER